MKTTSKFFLLIIVLLVVALGTVSASENVSDVSKTSELSVVDDFTDDNILSKVNSENDVQGSSVNKTIKKNIENDDCEFEKSSSNLITVTSSNYDYFFSPVTDTEFVKTTDLIQSGDTINLQGTFNNVKFAVDKSITFTSINKNAKLYNCTVYVLGQNSSGSKISNLTIYNDGTLLKGIQVKNSSNLLIEDNHITTYGLRAYGFVADYMNNSTICSNYFVRAGDDWRYITFVIGRCFYNNIANNTIHSGGANGIYLSIYDSLDANFDGGESDYNNITGNTIVATGNISSWCYTIQVMGAHNIVSYNNVTGGFRGISTEGYESNIVTNNEVHAIAEGIFACENAIVSNNLVDVSGTSRGIKIGGNGVRVVNNTISSIDGQAIEISGNNEFISNNTIVSSNSYGIYLKGQYTTINIDNNKINSQKEGIIFKQQSRYKKTNNVVVTRNIITSQDDYAINFEEVENETGVSNITVSSSNVLTSSRGIGLSVAYKKPFNAIVSEEETDTNDVNHINMTNYNSFFENGVATPLIRQNATVYLEGVFENCNFTFNKKVHVIGNNCEIRSGTIVLAGDSHSSTITNVTFKNLLKDSTRHAIELVEVNNCRITNVVISNVAEYESIGIFLFGSNGNRIFDCYITTNSDYINNGILTYSSDSNIFKNNIIQVNQSGVQVPYADTIMFDERIGIIQEVLHNHGIILLYSSDNSIDNNIINVKSGFTQYTFPTNDCKNSIVGIDIYFDSHRNSVINNNINFKSYCPFVYGMGVLGGYWGSSITAMNATDNVFKFNKVRVDGGYFATGFIAGRNSVNTLIDSNNFSVYTYRNSTNRGDYVHGITLENSTTSTIKNNNIGIVGTSVYSIELFDSNLNTVFNNSITAKGTNPYGLAGYRSSNNNITNNSFTLRQFDYGTSGSAMHSDVISAGDEGIMFMSSSSKNNITFNKVDTNTTCAVMLSEQTRNNYVVENSLKSKGKVGDASVFNEHTSNVVSNNFLHFVNVTADSVTAKLGDTVDFVAHIETTGIDLNNLRVTFKLGSTDIGTVGVVNNVATLSYQLNSTFWRDTTYPIMVSVKGTNFQNASVQSQATFSKDPEATVVKVANVSQTQGKNVTLIANITSVSGAKVGTGYVQFYLDGTLLGTVFPQIGVARMNYTIASNAPNVMHFIKVDYHGSSIYLNSTGTGYLGVQTTSAITATTHTGTIGQSVKFNATVKSGGKAVTSGKINIYIDDTFINSKNIVNGSVLYTYNIPYTFNKGNHNLKFIYYGNNTMSPANKTVILKLNPVNPHFSYVKTTVDVGQTANIMLRIDNGESGSNYCGADGGNVSIKLNGKELKDSSGKAIIGIIHNGTITFKFIVPKELIGSNNISFNYSGDNIFNTGNKNYNNALIVNNLTHTNIELYNLNPATKGSTVKLSGKLLSNGVGVKNMSVTVSVDGKNFTASTYSSGYFTVNYTVTSYDSQKVDFKFAGNANYASCSNSTTLQVKQPTTIEIYKLSTASKGSTVKLSGKLLSNGVGVKNMSVTVSVDGKNFTASTYSSGYFTVNYTVTSYDSQKVDFKFAGNANYASCSNSTTLQVKQPTTIEIYKLSTASKGSTVKLSGKLLSNGAAVKGVTVTVTVGGNKYTATTYSSGYFTVNYTVTSYDPQTVKFTFAGNSNYESKTNSTTLKVKQPTTIELYSMSTVKVGSTIKVSGKLLSNGAGVKNQKVVIKINSNSFTATTYSSGYFTINYTVTALGTNNITFTYAGADGYLPIQTTQKFTATT